jgi:hypothetical protein
VNPPDAPAKSGSKKRAVAPCRHAQLPDTASRIIPRKRSARHNPSTFVNGPVAVQRMVDRRGHARRIEEHAASEDGKEGDQEEKTPQRTTQAAFMTCRSR